MKYGADKAAEGVHLLRKFPSLSMTVGLHYTMLMHAILGDKVDEWTPDENIEDIAAEKAKLGVDKAQEGARTIRKFLPCHAKRGQQ